MTILDHVGKTERVFRPHTVNEFLALTLARKLADPSNVLTYVQQVSQCPLEIVFRAYRNAVDIPESERTAPETFMLELSHLLTSDVEFKPGCNQD